MGRKQQTEVQKETVQPRRSSRRKRANDDEEQPKVCNIRLRRHFSFTWVQACVQPTEKAAESAANKIAESVKPEKVRTKRRTGSGPVPKLPGPEPGTTPRPSKKRKINAVDLPVAEYSVTYGNKTIKFTELNFGAFKIKATKPQI